MSSLGGVCGGLSSFGGVCGGLSSLGGVDGGLPPDEGSGLGGVGGLGLFFSSSASFFYCSSILHIIQVTGSLMYGMHGSLPSEGGDGFLVGSGLGGAPEEVAGLGLSPGVGAPPVGGLEVGGGVGFG